MAINALLSLQFDVNGCLSRNVINLGGITFNSNSSLGDQNLRCAYFNPDNKGAGFYWEDSSYSIKYWIDENPWSLYFKFKIKKDDLLQSTPIITYNIMTDDFQPFLMIENYKFVLYTSDPIIQYKTRNLDYIFDNTWHTFYLCYDKYGNCKIMIDGYIILNKSNAARCDISDKIYIGLANYKDRTDNFVGFIDDWNIFDDALWDSYFIPPSDFVIPFDSLSNYVQASKIRVNDFNDDIIDSIEKNIEHTSSYLNNIQSHYYPFKLNITWYEVRNYFEKAEYQYLTKSNTDTIINVTGLNQVILNNQYYTGNFQTLVETKAIFPLMIFLNNRFIPLSKIELIKSDNWYSLVFKDRDIAKNDPVFDLKIILIPFSIIYEENYGERADIEPLFSFNTEGLLDPGNSNVLYYIDTDNNPNLKFIGIREQYYSSLDSNYKESNSEYMSMIFRTGTFEDIRLDENNTGCYMTFKSDQYGYIKPGDNILLYNGVILVDPSLYSVVGYDYVYFPDFKRVGIRPGRTVTIQIISDIQENSNQMIFQDLTDIKIVSVEAEYNYQAIFNIPIIKDNNGYEYKKFIVFKGHLAMEENDRYEINYDNNTIRLKNQYDFLAKGRHLDFVFIKLNKSNANGNLFVKPYFIYAKLDQQHLYRKTTLNIPDSIKITKRNSMAFLNGTFLNPDRYILENNTVTLTDTDYNFNQNTNLVFVMLKIVDITEDNNSNWRDDMINQELRKGNRFILYDLGIDKQYKIDLNNIISFDQYGQYIDDLKGSIYNLNIIKNLRTTEPLSRQVRYICCLYRTDLPEYESNINDIPNETFIKEYIKGREEFDELDDKFDDLMSEFDYTHDKQLHYGENLSRALDYMLTYNQNKFDEVYEKNSEVKRTKYNTSIINSKMVKQDNIYKTLISKNNNTSMIFFENGKLANFNIQDKGNSIELQTNNRFTSDTKLESLSFKNIDNFIYELNTIVRSDNHYIYDLVQSITVGYEINKDFFLKMTTLEYYNYEFNLSIEVVKNDNMGYQFIHNDYKQDILTQSLYVEAIYSEEVIDCSIEVELLPEGDNIDYNSYSFFEDFTASITVKSK